MRESGRGPRSVPEIREAVALFESWERSMNDLSAAKHFTEAVQLLDDYLECEPESPHKQFIQNLKVSNTRRLLQQLAQIDKTDFALWLEYALVALALVDREAESIMDANPGLKADFDAFRNVWGAVLAEALQRVQKGEG